MIELGLVSAILPELTLAETLAVCRAEGYSYLEVMCWPVGAAERRYAGVTHIDFNKLVNGEADRIRDTVGASGVRISALGYYPNPLAPDEAEAQAAVSHIRKVIAGARALGIDTVTTFIGRDWHLSVDANWPRFRKTWPDLIRFAEDHGVRIAIENCPMAFTKDEWPGGKNLATTPVIWRRMFNEIPSDSFGLNYDPSHLIWQFMDEIRPIREFAPKFFHVHAKDAAIDRERLNENGIMATSLSFHAPRLPGLGDVRWGKFFAELTAAGYHGPVCVEVEDRAFEKTLDDRLRSVRQSERYLAQFVPGPAAWAGRA
jgi:sugar phosphate isomerase/epimerase